MSKTTKTLIGVIILIIVFVVIISTVDNRNSKDSVKVGVEIPLSGNRADVGEYVKNALVLASEYIENNKEYVKLDFIYEDTKYDPTTAVTAIKKLIDLDKVKYIIGPGGSSEALAVAPVAEQNKTILIIPGAQTDELSNAGDYIFRTIYNSSQEVPIFGPFVAQHMKGNTIHFLAMNTAISDPYIKKITPILESKGKKVGLVEKFDSKEVDFQAMLTKIKNNNPTDIFIIAVPKQAGLIIKKAREMGITAQFYDIGVESAEIFTSAGDLANGLIYPYSFDGVNGTIEQKEFSNNYVKRFGKEPDTVAANAYDAAVLLSACLYKKGDDVEKVKQCLYDTTDYRGVSGTFSIDKNGDAVKEIFIKTIRDGKFVKYE